MVKLIIKNIHNLIKMCTKEILLNINSCFKKNKEEDNSSFSLH